MLLSVSFFLKFLHHLFSVPFKSNFAYVFICYNSWNIRKQSKRKEKKTEDWLTSIKWIKYVKIEKYAEITLTTHMDKHVCVKVIKLFYKMYEMA